MSDWVTSSGFTAQPMGQNVYEAAIERINALFDRFEHIVVSFSGGKDSTVVFELALRIAGERGRLPLHAWMFDDEIIDPDTVAHAAQVAANPNVAFRWYCLPIRHTLRSKSRPCWFTWDEDERHLWARELPPGAITHVDGWEKGKGGIAEACALIFRGEREMFPNAVMLSGIRAEESFNRRRVLMGSGKWIVDRPAHHYAKPIYDWSWRDVWKAIRENGWAYSAYYDKLHTEGSRSPREQRIAPWGNVASAREAKLWAVFYPDFYDKAIRRLPELRPMALYGDTKLYRQVMNKPAGMTWQAYAFHLVEQFDHDDDRAFWTDEIGTAVTRWARKFSIPFPEEQVLIDGKPLSSCWKHLCYAIAKNDRIGGSSRDLL